MFNHFLQNVHIYVDNGICTVLGLTANHLEGSTPGDLKAVAPKHSKGLRVSKFHRPFQFDNLTDLDPSNSNDNLLIVKYLCIISKYMI